MNKIARKLREKNYFFKRLFDIWMDNLWVDKYIIFSFDLNRIDLSVKHEKIDIDWYLAKVEDCNEWSTSKPSEFSIDTRNRFVQLIQRDDWIVFGRCCNVDNSPARQPITHAACVFQKKPMSKNICFQINQGEGFIMTVYTNPQSRGLGIATGCIENICRRAKSVNIEKLYIDISTANVSSIRAASKAGAIPTSNGCYILRFMKHSIIFPFGTLKNRFVRGNI